MANPAVAPIDFYSEQGTTFRYRLMYGYSALPADQITGVGDIDGYYDLDDGISGAKMYIRTWDRATIVQRLSTEDGSIVLNAIQGSIDLYISDEDTDLWWDKKYRHDFEFEYDNGDVIKKYSGTIFNNVTQTRELD